MALPHVGIPTPLEIPQPTAGLHNGLSAHIPTRSLDYFTDRKQAQWEDFVNHELGLSLVLSHMPSQRVLYVKAWQLRLRDFQWDGILHVWEGIVWDEEFSSFFLYAPTSRGSLLPVVLGLTISSSWQYRQTVNFQDSWWWALSRSVLWEVEEPGF